MGHGVKCLRNVAVRGKKSVRIKGAGKSVSPELTSILPNNTRKGASFQRAAGKDKMLREVQQRGRGQQCDRALQGMWSCPERPLGPRFTK